jgi:NADH dehydrogenase [ubiquinone] 1 alpha subcomplex assembly factor 7
MKPELELHQAPLDLFIARGINFYYRREKKIFGEDGDFITASFSQLFCHSLASYFYLFLSKSEVSVTLVELGPGDAKLMLEILTFLSRDNKVFSKIKQIVLVESSSHLIAIQKKILSKFPIKLVHLKDFIQFNPEEPFLLVANEFFDALPVKQIMKSKKEYYEVWVDLLDKKLLLKSQTFSKDFLQAIMKNSGLALEMMQDGDLYEFSPVSLNMIETLAAKLSKLGGAAIILDYGYTSPPLKNTIKAIKNHQILENFLDFSGEADLSVQVDFTALKNIIEIKYPKLQVRLLDQIKFLQENFLSDLIKSAKKLAKNHEEKKSLQAEIAFLEGMTQFKVLEILR